MDNNYEEMHPILSIIIKFIIILSVFFSSSYIKSNISLQINNFKNILPKTNLSYTDSIPSLEEIFSSRELYINANNLTNDYINYIRKINQTEEDIYSQKLYPNLEFNELFKITRDDQYDVIDYYNLCNNGTLLGTNIYPIKNKDYPLISIVLPSYNKEKDLLKTVRSIQNQSFKNIEIILVNDCSTDNSSSIFNLLLNNDPRIRVFHHEKNMGCWRSRLDGFLYSRGKYILHFDTGDIFIDNYVLEDVYKIADEYKLDSVRFSYQWVSRGNLSHSNFRKVFPKEYTKIRYGHVHYVLSNFGYGTIWNRLTRANIFTKGLNLVDHLILNAYKNLWEDGWWNQLANEVSNSHLTINRVGYAYFPSYLGEGMLKVDTKERKAKAIREFIYFWLFDYQILPKDNNKKTVIDEMRKFVIPGNSVRNRVVVINYLKKKFVIYEILLNLLLKDKYVEERDKIFIKELYDNYTNIIKKKKKKIH